MINRSWYKNLKTSQLSPPDYVFGIVWPLLYTLISVSFILLVTDKDCVGICKPIPFFIVQMIFNLMWTTIFFRFKMIKTALLVTLTIIALTLITFNEMMKINSSAAYLLIPYILWLIFAAYLNFVIVLQN